METDPKNVPGEGSPRTRAQEVGTFLVLAGLVAPLLAVATVATYGFVVWMSQLLLGPPHA